MLLKAKIIKLQEKNNTFYADLQCSGIIYNNIIVMQPAGLNTLPKVNDFVMLYYTKEQSTSFCIFNDLSYSKNNKDKLTISYDNNNSIIFNDNDIDIYTKDKVSIKNDSTNLKEILNLLKSIAEKCSGITITNPETGTPLPINNVSDFVSITSQLTTKIESLLK